MTEAHFGINNSGDYYVSIDLALTTYSVHQVFTSRSSLGDSLWFSIVKDDLMHINSSYNNQGSDG